MKKNQKNEKPPRMGRCYVDTYKYFIYQCNIIDAVLVHGIVHGRNDLQGWVYGHAWIEISDVLFQPVPQGNEHPAYKLGFLGRKEAFYDLYQVEENTIRRYTKEEALIQAAKTGHYGAWHELGLGERGFKYYPKNA